MRKVILASVLLLSGGGLALAQTDADTNPENAGNLSSEVADDHPGTEGGKTDKPTAQPSTSAIGDKATKTLEDADKGGTTKNPTAKPQQGELVEDPPKTP